MRLENSVGMLRSSKDSLYDEEGQIIFALIYINFSFDFPGLDKVYFENNFGQSTHKIRSFLSKS